MSTSIKKDILTKLQAASSYTPDYSLTVASLWQKWFDSLAVRTGTTPEMLYSAVNIDIDAAESIAERLDKEIYAPSATALPFLTNSEKINYFPTVESNDKKIDERFFVATEENKPITLFHGSFGDIEKFDEDKIGPFNRLGQAFYFTSSSEDASENYASPDSPELQAKAQNIQSALKQSGVALKNIDYPKIKAALAENGGAVYPVHLAMKSPLIISDSEPYKRGEHDPAIKMGAVFSAIILDHKGDATQSSKLHETLEACRSTKDAVNEITQFSADNNMPGLPLQIIKRSGYDGVIDKTAGELWHTPDDATHYIVFKPEQIVSALSLPLPDQPKYESVLYQYAGVQAQYADEGMLETAKKMQQAGDNEELIRQTTGWHQWVDGQWRFEIADGNAFLNHEKFSETNHHHHRAMERMAGPGTRFMDLSQPEQDRILNLPPSAEFVGQLNDVLYHPGLFNHYPQLKDLLVDVQISPDITRAYGHYQPDSHTATVRANSLNEALKTTLHELQHGIQAIEGFSFGGTPEDYSIPTTAEANEIRRVMHSAMLLLDYAEESNVDLSSAARDLGNLITPETRVMARNCDKSEIERFINDQRHQLKTPAFRYHYLAGEYEARDVESRINLSIEERLITPPYSSEKIRPADLEVKTLDSTGSKAGRVPLAAVLRDNSKTNFMILLSTCANESSFLHESSHVILDLFSAEALKENAPQCLVKDYEAICQYLGCSPGQAFTEEQEELWARTVEAYFLDNNSMIPEVKRVEEWMRNVYASVSDLGVQPTKEINDVITRMFDGPGEGQGIDTEFDVEGISSQLSNIFVKAPEDSPMH